MDESHYGMHPVLDPMIVTGGQGGNVARQMERRDMSVGHSGGVNFFYSSVANC